MKIMIVDDEKISRDMLKYIILRYECGFEVVAEAENAEEAFLKYKKLRPDVVITDICMNGADGLDLISSIKKYDGNKNIIVISAYEEFEYARRAYEGGALTYLLKPVDENELIQKLLFIKRKTADASDGFADERYREHISFIRENYFKDILTNPFSDTGDFHDKCRNFGIESTESFVVAKIYIDEFYKMSDEEQGTAGETLSEVLAHSESLAEDKCVRVKISECERCVVCFLSDDREKAKATQYIEELFMSLQEEFVFLFNNRTEISVGISKVYQDPSYMYEAYIEANDMIYSAAWHGRGGVISKENIPSDINLQLFMTKEENDKICDACVKNDKALLREGAEAFFERIRCLKYVEIEILQNIIAVAILNVTRNVVSNDEEMIFRERFNLFSEVGQCKNLDMLKECFIKKVAVVLEAEEKNKKNDNIKKILKIVEEKYAEKITVETIAEEMHFSASYILRIFKTEMGESFHAYLTGFRIKKAIELLNKGNLKISEVSERVGYDDASYFGQVFKRVTGVTPSGYLKGLM